MKLIWRIKSVEICFSNYKNVSWAFFWIVLDLFWDFLSKSYLAQYFPGFSTRNKLCKYWHCTIIDCPRSSCTSVSANIKCLGLNLPIEVLSIEERWHDSQHLHFKKQLRNRQWKESSESYVNATERVEKKIYFVCHLRQHTDTNLIHLWSLFTTILPIPVTLHRLIWYYLSSGTFPLKKTSLG